MAKFSFKARKRPSVGYVITGVVTLGMYLLVGNKILTSVGTVIGNITNTPFYSALSFLGMTDETGEWTSTSIVGVLGLAAVAAFVLGFVKITLR